MSNKLLKSCVDDEIKSIGQGYIAHLEWMEKKSKRYKQLKCDRCGKYHIWKRKESADEQTTNN